MPGFAAVTGDPLRWIDPAAFQRPPEGYLGNLGRGTITGPDLANLDVSLAKRLRLDRLGEQAVLDLRLECFNVLNHPNFDLPTADRMEVFTSPTSIREDVGRITGAKPSREIQLGLKLRF